MTQPTIAPTPDQVRFVPDFGPAGARQLRRRVRRPPRRAGQVIAAVIATPCLLLLGSTLVEQAMSSGPVGFLMWNFPWVLILLAAAALWVWSRRRAWRAVAATIDSYAPRELATRQVVGEPGRGLSEGRFGSSAIAGRRGEQATVDTLAPLLAAYPAARLVNGLAYPGEKWDIDHALLLGDRFAVIDSKCWQPGHYWWDGASLYRHGEKLRAPQTQSVVEEFGHDFAVTGRRLRGRGWIVVHSTGPLTLEMVDNPAVRLVTPEGLLAEVTEFLSAAKGTTTVDRVALAGLLALLQP